MLVANVRTFHRLWSFSFIIYTLPDQYPSDVSRTDSQFALEVCMKWETKGQLWHGMGQRFSSITRDGTEWEHLSLKVSQVKMDWDGTGLVLVLSGTKWDNTYTNWFGRDECQNCGSCPTDASEISVDPYKRLKGGYLAKTLFIRCGYNCQTNLNKHYDCGISYLYWISRRLAENIIQYRRPRGATQCIPPTHPIIFHTLDALDGEQFLQYFKHLIYWQQYTVNTCQMIVSEYAIFRISQ